MTKSMWGTTPLDLLEKLSKLGIEEPKDLPEEPELTHLLGEADARAIRQEVDREYIPY